MAYKVQIQYDEPIPECCSDCRFNYDWLYCVLDMENQITLYEDGCRPSHCKLMQTADYDDIHSIAVRLFRFFNTVSIEDDDDGLKKEQLAKIINDLCVIGMGKEHDAERGDE